MIPITDEMVLIDSIDIVNSNVPVLIGLYLLDKQKVLVTNIENDFQCPTFGCNIPLSQKHGRM